MKWISLYAYTHPTSLSFSISVSLPVGHPDTHIVYYRHEWLVEGEGS